MNTGVLRCMIIIKYANGDSGPSIGFMEESPVIVLANDPWSPVDPSETNAVENAKYALGGHQLDAAETLDTMEGASFYKTHIKPQIEHILDMLIQAINFMYSRYELCDNNNSSYFKGCFQPMGIDVELDPSISTFPNGKVVPKCFLSAVYAFPFAQKIYRDDAIPKHVSSILQYGLDKSNMVDKSLAQNLRTLTAEYVHPINIRQPERLQITKQIEPSLSHSESAQITVKAQATNDKYKDGDNTH